jgi:glycosyltransferase involved in cell wall biosynthesis
MPDRIQVLLISKSTGGVGEYLRWIANGLDKSRFKLTVACMSTGGKALADQLSQQSGVSAVYIPMVRYLIEPFSDSLAFIRLARLIRRQKFDLIHAHASKPGFLGRLAAIGSRVPVIFSPHGFSFHRGKGPTVARIYAILERIAARYLTAKIIIVAQAEYKLAQEFGVGKKDQFITIHSGIEMTEYDNPVDPIAIRRSLQVPVDTPLVGAVGRLNAQKHPLNLIKAAELIHEKRPDIHFVWVGDGPLLEAALKAVRAANLHEVFHFPGYRADISQIMKCLDCFALPSLWEAFPLTVLEAMAAGIPVVATNVDGVPEAVIDQETGILVPPQISTELAKGILHILDNPEISLSMGQAGNDRVKQMFTRGKMLEKLEQVYINVANIG